MSVYEPAFPIPSVIGMDRDGNMLFRTGYEAVGSGLTKGEKLAAMFIQGILSNNIPTPMETAISLGINYAESLIAKCEDRPTADQRSVDMGVWIRNADHHRDCAFHRGENCSCGKTGFEIPF